jgi:hypothetical protein
LTLLAGWHCFQRPFGIAPALFFGTCHGAIGAEASHALS